MSVPQLNKQYSDIYRSSLLDDVLPFWIKHAVDKEYGGFMFCLDRDGTIIDTDKGMWQQCRFTWLVPRQHPVRIFEGVLDADLDG